MKLVDTRVLVTGGTGFIGRHVVGRLLDDGHDVIGLDQRPWVDAPCPTLNVDIRDRQAVRAALHEARPQVVIHLASLVGVRTSADDPRGYHETNVEGTTNVVDAAEECGARRFVFSSSSSVYGAATARASQETDALDPRSPYATTKAQAELVVRRFAGQTTIARLFTVYGPGMRTDLALRRFIEAITTGRAITMLGDGRSERDYTHVYDVVDGLVASLSRGGPQHLTCNLGSGCSVALEAVIETLCERLGRTARVIEAPVHPADAPHTRASLQQAALHLGYQPQFSFERGVDDLVRHLVHENRSCARTVEA